MANSFADNPFVLDTVTVAAAGVLATGVFIEVYAFRWASGSLADVVLINDSQGNAKYSASGMSASATDTLVFSGEKPLVMNGLTVSSLGSGKVYVYAKRTR